MAKRLKYWLADKALSREMAKKRNVQTIGYKSARNIALIALVKSKQDVDDTIWMRDYLKQEEGMARVDVLLIVPSKEKNAPDYLPNSTNIELVFQDNLEFNLVPKKALAKKLLKDEYDILISININLNRASALALAICKAKLKVGVLNKKYSSIFDLMIELKDGDDKMTYFKQVNHYLNQI